MADGSCPLFSLSMYLSVSMSIFHCRSLLILFSLLCLNHHTSILLSNIRQTASHFFVSHLFAVNSSTLLLIAWQAYRGDQTHGKHALHKSLTQIQVKKKKRFFKTFST